MNTDVTKRRLRKPEYWLALSAICLVSIFYYGIRAAALLGLAAVTAVLTDFFCLFLQNRSYKKEDLSNAAAALILVLMFPATVPYSIVILSTVFTVAVGIHVFGSRGNYLFPPAAVGYLFALICWKDEMLNFPKAGDQLLLFGNENVSLKHSLSSTFNAEGVLHADLLDLLIGAVYGPMGTGCILLLAAVLIILVIGRSASYWACGGFLIGISILSVFGRNPVWQHAAVNMLLFSMIFLVADTFTMPKGRISALFGSMLTGMLTMYLLKLYGIEYAVVVAVMLTAPAWHALSGIGERLGRKLDAIELAAKQRMAANAENGTIAEVTDDETEAAYEAE